MHSLSQNKIVTPPFDKEAIEGYSRSTINIDFSLQITPIFLALCVAVAVFLNISTQQFISKKIFPTQSGKPVFYFQFWAAILMGAVLIYAYFEPHSLLIWLIIGIGTVFNLLVWAIIVYISGNIAENSGNESQYVFSYSSPAATIPCLLGHFLWTIFGHVVTLLLVCISIYTIPNIIIVYYLYPLRTIKRVPLLLGGLFSMISLVARFIYLLEKQIELIKYILCHKMCGCSRHETLCCSKRHDDDYHFSFYANEIHDDLHKIIHQATDIVGCRGCFSIIIECINLVILMFETTFILFVICIYGFGQVMLAELVFENAGNQTSDNTSSVIIAFIPTILVTILTGAGIGLFFKFSIWNLMKQKDITESLTGDQSKNENKERKNNYIHNYSTLDALTDFSIPGRLGYVNKFKRLCSSLSCRSFKYSIRGEREPIFPALYKWWQKVIYPNKSRGSELDDDFLVDPQLSEESENELFMTNTRNGINELRVDPQLSEESENELFMTNTRNGINELRVDPQLSEESENELSMTNARNGTNELRVQIEQPPEIEVHQHP